MSYDLSVYTRDRSVEKTAFSIEMLNRGWRICFVDEGAWYGEVPAAFLATFGPLDSDHSILAWRQDDALAGQLESIVAGSDFGEFKKIAEESMSIAGVALTITAYDRREELEEQEQPIDSEPKDPLERELGECKWEHYLRTSGGRSPASFDFQHECWYAIAKLADGIALNPQSGEMFQSTPPQKQLPGCLGWFYRLINP